MIRWPKSCCNGPIDDTSLNTQSERVTQEGPAPSRLARVAAGHFLWPRDAYAVVPRRPAIPAKSAARRAASRGVSAATVMRTAGGEAMRYRSPAVTAQPR